MKKLAVIVLPLLIFLLALSGPSGRLQAFQEQPEWSDVFVIGIIEPYNRTEISGRLEIAPLFVEMMEKLFIDANYRVVRISQDMLYQSGYRVYHEDEPDTPLDSDQIIRLCEKYKIDVMVTANIYDYQKRSKAEFFHMKEFWKLSLEGLVFSGKTGKLALKVPLAREERVWFDSYAPPWQKQILSIDKQAITDLASGLLDKMGRKPRDTEPPVIDVRKPQDAQILRTTVVLLLGEISDTSEVYSITINGEEKEIVPRKSVKLYYPISYVFGKEKEHTTLSIVAKDIYGNTSSRTIGLAWGKPIWGYITKIEGKEISVNVGSRQGVARGMTFMACNIETFRDPVTGLPMFNFIEVGPVYVTRVYLNKSDCTFIHQEKAERMKKGDIVR